MRRSLILAAACLASACANEQEAAAPALQSGGVPLAARFQEICSSDAAMDVQALVSNSMRVRWANPYNEAFRPPASDREENFTVTERSAINALGVGDLMLAWRAGGTAYTEWLFLPDGIELENGSALEEFTTPPEHFDPRAGFGDTQVYRFVPVPSGGNCPASEAILDAVSFVLRYQRDWTATPEQDRRPLYGSIFPSDMAYALWPYAQLAGHRDYSQLIDIHDQLRARVAAGECLSIERISTAEMPYQPSHSIIKQVSVDGVLTEHRYEISGQRQTLFEERRVSWRPTGGELQRCCVTPYRGDGISPRQCAIPFPDDPQRAAALEHLRGGVQE